MRITNKFIETNIRQVNKLLNLPETEFKKEDGKTIRNIGHIKFDPFFNTISQVVSEGGGEHALFNGENKKQCNCFLQGIKQTIFIQNNTK